LQTGKYKMLVTDLDDSLLGHDLRISSSDKDALLTAARKGIIVTIATGRMFSSTLPYIKELGIDVPVITYQGAVIKGLLSNETLIHIPIENDMSRDLIRESKKDGYHIQAYIDDEYYIEQENEHSDHYKMISGQPGIVIEDLEECADKGVTKFIIIDKPDKVLELRDRYADLYGDSLQVTISRPNFLEFTHIDATKGNAIKYLAQKFGIDRRDIIAIGDSYNDISMIEYAGLGVAMGNAPEDIKSIADYVTLKNSESGVAHVVERFILGGVIS